MVEHARTRVHRSHVSERALAAVRCAGRIVWNNAIVARELVRVIERTIRKAYTQPAPKKKPVRLLGHVHRRAHASSANIIVHAAQRQQRL